MMIIKELENCERLVLTHLLERLAAVILGVKPGQLLALHCWDRNHSCQFFEKNKVEILAALKLKAMILRRSDRCVQIYFYRQDSLEITLGDADTKAFLEGYDYSGGVEENLNRLEERFRGKDFPHEIGIFLGYPLKDVLGFINGEADVKDISGPWKVYEPHVEQSLTLFKRYEDARRDIKKLIKNMVCMEEVFVKLSQCAS